MSHGNILVVDDERGILDQLAGILRDEGFSVATVATGEEALAAISREIFDLVLLDVWLPGIDGIETLRQLRAAGHQLPVVLISGHASAELAARAVKEGALDFLEKPLALERVLVTVHNALAHARLEQQLRAEREEEEPVLTGVSPAVVELRRQILLAAPTDSRVLISGPNGAGKEVVAKLLHLHSRRAQAPFVAVNCAAIPGELIESELFGHLKGAFTGAVENKRGKFEIADGGTLFLDEIANMPLGQQARLLRVIEAGEFERVGSSKTRRADVRLISATNANLPEEVKAGRFREDLLFRLNTVEVHLPPLRERREDIPLLANYFLRQHATRYQKRVVGFEDAAVRALLACPWPGNVRELDHVVERAVLLAQGDTVLASDLSLRAAREGISRLEEMSLEDVERTLIRKALERFAGNVSEAAKFLGLSRSGLYRRLQKYGL